MFLTQTAPVRLSYFVAMRLGDLFFFLWRKKRQITVENMRHVLGHDADPRQVVETARRSIRNYAKVIVEFLRLPRLSDQEVISLVKQSLGWEHLDRALAHGKGVILVLSHFGNWDLAGAVLAARTYPTNAVADSFRPERLNQLVPGPEAKPGGGPSHRSAHQRRRGSGALLRWHGLAASGAGRPFPEDRGEGPGGLPG
ncbi:MAG: hypothetical protein HY783_06545 [Chloroflexi bacterium]|nr:hypothetical protein [Chloroflexota bacterium]